MLKCDVATLADDVDRCFDRAVDGRLSPEQRKRYSAAGKWLRGAFSELVSARFNDGTQAVLDANTQIGAVNQKLQADAEAIDNAVQTLNSINKLVGVLDQLLEIAVSVL